jgi:hypothetical protein
VSGRCAFRGYARTGQREMGEVENFLDFLED